MAGAAAQVEGLRRIDATLPAAAVGAQHELRASAPDTAARDRLTGVTHADHGGAHAGVMSVERAAVLARAAAWTAVAHRGRSARRSIGVARAGLGVGVLVT